MGPPDIHSKTHDLRRWLLAAASSASAGSQREYDTPNAPQAESLIQSRRERTGTVDVELVIVMDPRHRLTASTHVQPRDLAGESVFCYPPKEESTLVLKVLRPAGVQPARVMEVPLTESIVDMVSAGLGVALLARWAVKNYLASGKIVTRPLNKSGFRRRWYAATLRTRPMTPYLTEFINLLVRSCSLDSVPS